MCSIRPEALRLVRGEAPDDANTLTGRRVQTVYLGDTAQHRIEVGKGTVLTALQIKPDAVAPADEKLTVSVAVEDIVILPD